MTDLVFVRTANPVQGGPIDLVFGASSGPAVPTVQVEGGGQISGLRGLAMVRTVVRASGGGQISGIRGTAQVQWDANVSRSTRVELGTTWGDAGRVSSALAARWQDAAPMRVATETRWQDASKLRAALGAHWQEAERLRVAVSVRWQEAQGLRAALGAHWEDGERLRAAVSVRWQGGVPLRGALASAWQDTLRLRAAVRSYWQEAVALRATAGGGFGDAVAVRVGLQTRWQEAMRPQAGVSEVVIPVKPGCYKPGLPVDLVFRADRVVGLPVNLVFRCHGRLPPDPEAPQFVIPLLRVYMTVHTIDAVLLPSLERLPLKGITVSSDDDGFGWSLTASGPADPLHDMLAPVNGEPKQIKVSIDGIDFVFAVEQPERSRRFLEHAVQVRGSSVTSLLGSPHVPASTWSTPTALTAQQIILQALQFTGVDLDWRIDDWLVPAAAWSHQGTPLSVAQRVAEAAGAVLRSHRTLPQLQVAPRFPYVPWEWSSATPNVRMPGQIITNDGLQTTAGVEYNAVYVSGSVQGAIVGHVVRTGTAGDVLAPEVPERLVTDVTSARQRGISVLAAAALTRRHSMTVPLLTGGTNPGLILPGYLIEVQEPGEVWRGLVRGLTVTTGVPTVRQQLVVERAE